MLRLSLSQRAQHIRYRPGLSSLGTNLITCQIHVPHGAIDLQGFCESLKETQDVKDPGQQLQQVKLVKRLGEARCKGNMGKGVKVALSGVSQVVSWMECGLGGVRLVDEGW